MMSDVSRAEPPRVNKNSAMMLSHGSASSYWVDSSASTFSESWPSHHWAPDLYRWTASAQSCSRFSLAHCRLIFPTRTGQNLRDPVLSRRKVSSFVLPQKQTCLLMVTACLPYGGTKVSSVALKKAFVLELWLRRIESNSATS